MIACTGCGAFPADAVYGPWVCQYCQRPNHAAPVAAVTRPKSGKNWASNATESLDVHSVLHSFAHADDLFVGEAIPGKKLTNGLKACGEPKEPVLALADLTVFGSAKNCVLFTQMGVYYRNDWSGKQPGTHFVAYADMDVDAIDEGDSEVHLGAGGFINIAGSSLEKHELVAILKGLERAT